MRYSTIQTIQVDELRPNFVFGHVQQSSLADETQLLQLGNVSEVDFFEMTWDTPRPSAWRKFPTNENPNFRYKFSSISLRISPDLIVIERQTYGLLEWLGDIGGLFDALIIIGKILVGPISAFNLKATLLSRIFRYTRSLAVVDPMSVGVESEEKLKRHMKWDFENAKLIRE